MNLQPIKTVLLVQASHSFAAGVLGVALPLMMKDRQVDIVVVGFVFAAMPLVMQLGRMFFATLSDFWGRKVFFVSGGLLGVVSCLIYYGAHTPLEYMFGKVAEGTKEGALWAVNRPLLLEEGRGDWRVLVNLRTVVYMAYALGSFIAGFLIALVLFEGAMLVCAVFGALVIVFSLTLTNSRKSLFNIEKAKRFLDVRKKEGLFKAFFVLFCLMGVSFGLIGGFVITWLLSQNGFDLEMIGLILGLQILLAGIFSYLFSKTKRMKIVILLSGFLFSFTFLLLGFTNPVIAGILVIFFGVVQGVSSVGQEGILTAVSNKTSYGTDIGLLWTGFHVAESLSLALTGFLISIWGFAVPFVLSALTYIVFSVGAYTFLKE